MSQKPVEQWSVDEVVSWIESLGLASLAPAFRENAVAGKDLLSLTDEDYLTSLGTTKLHMKKIMRALQDAQSGSGSKLTADSSDLSAAPSAPEEDAAPAASSPAPAAASAGPYPAVNLSSDDTAAAQQPSVAPPAAAAPAPAQPPPQAPTQGGSDGFGIPPPLTQQPDPAPMMAYGAPMPPPGYGGPPAGYPGGPPPPGYMPGPGGMPPQQYGMPPPAYGAAPLPQGYGAGAGMPPPPMYYPPPQQMPYGQQYNRPQEDCVIQ